MRNLFFIAMLLFALSIVSWSGVAVADPSGRDVSRMEERSSTSFSRYFSKSYWAERHALGIEYGLDNDVFNGLINDLALNLTLKAGLPQIEAADRAREIVLAIKNEISRVSYARNQTLDFQFAFQTAMDIVEVVLVSKLPGISVPLSAAKAVTAFVTAYSYGFLVGR